eukprot:4144727-Prymnesium_polylepis.1
MRVGAALLQRQDRPCKPAVVAAPAASRARVWWAVGRARDTLVQRGAARAQDGMLAGAPRARSAPQAR